ncbi:aminotransferase class I/II-fold pyridoxal phosphate-dependent enzyme [Kallipyga gabonensis]|uniref:aminotransferase class I/II-fold pyridoxal phosphate-dependent enzyme n=1 Tax=Kallipyga gabonensis TaxID=1686287 RepID=UPI0006B4FC60|nr:aminotransferase class I/II-fold pyridoxal phosphate-dependent enzyme [Kallipyga gabonensis]
MTDRSFSKRANSTPSDTMNPLTPPEKWKPDRTYDHLLDAIRSYGASGITPFHMPGHKQNTRKFGNLLPYALDMTETAGMADLHHPSGRLKEAQEELARSRGARASFFSIAGSTAGILSGMRTLTRRGDKVLLSRGSHRSVYHGLEILGLRGAYLLPRLQADLPLYLDPDPDLLKRRLEEEKDVKLVLVTSPTFEGAISDLQAMARICHDHGALLMVDQAHGAHLTYLNRLDHERYPEALAAGADLVVESLHKTLPALTPAALVHCSDRVDPAELARNLSIFETSSPSHPLMASMDACLTYMEKEGLDDLDRLRIEIRDFRDKARKLKLLEIVDLPAPNDPLKILISCQKTRESGQEVTLVLRKLGFEFEMTLGPLILAMPSIGNESGDLDHLARALLDLDRDLHPVKTTPVLPNFPLPPKVMEIDQALDQPMEVIKTSEAEGRVAGESVWAYPPGIPILLPGEKITNAWLSCMKYWVDYGQDYRSDRGLFPRQIQALRSIDE